MFGKIRVLRMQLDGNIREEELQPQEIEMYLGQAPVISIPIGGGLQIFCSADAKRPNDTSERVTLLYSTAGHIRAGVYGNTLIGRRDYYGYRDICDADISIARWLLHVIARTERISE